MCKYIRAKFSDGSMYDVPAEIIADYAARNYALLQRETSPTPYIENYSNHYKEVYLDNVQLVKESHYIPWDYIKNNIYKVEEEPEPIDLKAEWKTTQKRVHTE